MAGMHALDRLIASEFPTFATEADLRAFQQVPYADRIAAQSTYEAIKLGAAKNPDAPAIQFLPNADPAETPIVIPRLRRARDTSSQHVSLAWSKRR